MQELLVLLIGPEQGVSSRARGKSLIVMSSSLHRPPLYLGWIYRWTADPAGDRLKKALQAFQPPVFFPQLAQLSQFGHAQAGIMLLPDSERALADPQASADIAHLFPAFHPLQGSNDLLFRVCFLRHLSLSSIGILEGRSPKITPASLGSVFGFWVRFLAGMRSGAGAGA